MAKTDGLQPPWKPGECGNPNGRPKGTKNRATYLKEILALLEPSGKDREYHINEAIVTKAMEGDLASFKEIQDTLYGKIADKQIIAETTPDKIDDVTDKVLSKLTTEELEEINGTSSN